MTTAEFLDDLEVRANKDSKVVLTPEERERIQDLSEAWARTVSFRNMSDPFTVLATIYWIRADITAAVARKLTGRNFS